MGLFSSETVVRVATSVSRAISDSMVPNTILSGTLKGLFSDEDDLPSILVDELAHNLTMKVESAYRYGKSTYVFGLPEANIHRSTDGAGVIEDMIEQQLGQPVTWVYSRFGAYNYFHYAWQLLTEQYGYDRESNALVELARPGGIPVYLDDFQIVFAQSLWDRVDPGATQCWGEDPDTGYTPLRPLSKLEAIQAGSASVKARYVLDATRATHALRVYLIWKEGGALQRQTLTLDLPDEVTNPNDDPTGYFQAEYIQQVGEQRQRHFFTYREGSGTYPVLDTFFDTPRSELGSFYPWVHFRLHNTPVNVAGFGSNVTQSMQRLSKRYGFKYDDLFDAIHANPDIGYVMNATMMMGVPADTTHPLEIRYLFDFFNRLAVDIGNDKPPVRSGGGISFIHKQRPALYAYRIADRAYAMSLGFDSLHKDWRMGSIGPVGTCTTTTENFSYDTVTTVTDEAGNSTDVTQSSIVPALVLRKQITSIMYAEIQIVQLTQSYTVEGGHETTAVFPNPNLLIPVDHAITREYPNSERETLYARSMHYIFNSRTETKVRWYQQDWFGMVLQIVAIIWTIWSWGSDGGAGAAWLIGLGSYVALAVIIAIRIVIMVVTAWVFKLLVKAIGVEAAMVVAIVAACYGAAEAIDAGGLAGAPFAADLLNLSVGLTSGAQSVLKDEFLDLQHDIDVFKTNVEKETELLEEAKKLLAHNTRLSPFVLFGETPKEYYQRTIHSGNIGVISLDAVSHFVETSLQLPKLATTISEGFDDER